MNKSQELIKLVESTSKFILTINGRDHSYHNDIDSAKKERRKQRYRATRRAGRYGSDSVEILHHPYHPDHSNMHRDQLLKPVR